MTFYPMGALRGPQGFQGPAGTAGDGGNKTIRFFTPMDFDAVGDGVADDQTALTDCFEAAAMAGGIVIIDRPYGFSDKIKHYGGMQVWQVATPRILVSPTGPEPGLIALEDTAWYQYGDGSDGSGSANDNPGPIRGLCIDGATIAGIGDGLFVMDANQSSLYDLMVINSAGVGLHVGRSQNCNFFNPQIGGNDTGVLLKPLVAGQQGPGHNIFFGGHYHDNVRSLLATNHSSSDFFYPHDNVFKAGLFETGRVTGQAVEANAVIESGQIQFDDCNFTFGAQVGTGGNNVTEDCVILIDNPVYVAYSTRVSIRGGSIGGGVNGVTDGIRVKQSGAANILQLAGDIGWANIDYRVCDDGIVLGGADAQVSHTGTDVDATGGIAPIRSINSATKLNVYNKSWQGRIYELPTGLANGDIQNPIVIRHKDETYSRASWDWNAGIRHLDPTTGATIGSILPGTNGYGINGENLVQIAAVTNATRPAASTLTHRLVLNTDTSRLEWSDGSTWQPASTPGGGAMHLGTTATASATAAKTATVSGYTPTAGDLLALTLTNGNSAASPTLALNGGSAVNILLAGSAPSLNGDTTSANGVWVLYFDGTSWHLVGSMANLSSATQAQAEAGTATANLAWSPLRVAQAIAALSDPTDTTSNLNSAAATVNTTGKRAGKRIFNTTSNRPVWATGSTTTSTWVYGDGTTAHTPA